MIITPYLRYTTLETNKLVMLLDGTYMLSTKYVCITGNNEQYKSRNFFKGVFLSRAASSVIRDKSFKYKGLISIYDIHLTYPQGMQACTK